MEWSSSWWLVVDINIDFVWLFVAIGVSANGLGGCWNAVWHFATTATGRQSFLPGNVFTSPRIDCWSSPTSSNVNSSCSKRVWIVIDPFDKNIQIRLVRRIGFALVRPACSVWYGFRLWRSSIHRYSFQRLVHDDRNRYPWSRRSASL